MILARIASSPTGMKVQTIEDVALVREIGWEEGSDIITVTTDSQVYYIDSKESSILLIIDAPLRSSSILWRGVQSQPHVGSVQEKTHFLCVAGVQWRTSVLGGLSVSTALSQGDGYRAPVTVSPPLSLPPSSFWTLPLL